MNDRQKNSDKLKRKKGRKFAIAAAVLFGFAGWFAFLGFYLLNSMRNYKPEPDMVQEGDMVSALLMMLMFAVAVSLLASSVLSISFYIYVRYFKAA